MKGKAQTRYEYLSSFRENFLRQAWNGSRLTLPYLIKRDEDSSTYDNLTTPWQSVGAKGVVTLSAKLMLALLPPQGAFFKLQLDELAMQKEQMDPKIASEIDLSFAKIERTMMESIAASYDRVVIHQAMKHLVVSGNALVFMDKDEMKMYPLNRFVIDRDGKGNVIEIVTKESINKELVMERMQEPLVDQAPGDNPDNNDTVSDQVDVYTHVKRDGKKFRWHQEVFGKIIPGTESTSTIENTPWIPLRFNTVDDEAYGRGRVEEFIGDLQSLEALSQAIIEGSAAAAKVIFTVSPSASTKPQTLAQAGNGAIVQGRPDDIGVVQVGKTADFQTAYQLAQELERRLSEAFLILQVRQSERTTAEEVRVTQMELDQQLGGLYSLLTVDFLVPYLNRKLQQAQKQGDIPKLPKEFVKPTIVAGVTAIGRGSDREALTMFMTTLAQTMGPEAIAQYINADEVVKRLAASSGIDTLNLVKTMDERQAEAQQQQKAATDLEMTKQASQFQKNSIEQDNAGNPQGAGPAGGGQPPVPPPQA